MPGMPLGPEPLPVDDELPELPDSPELLDEPGEPELPDRPLEPRPDALEEPGGLVVVDDGLKLLSVMVTP